MIFPRDKYYMMYLYLDQTVVIYLSENDAGDCSLNMDLKWHRKGEQRSIPLCISYYMIIMNSCTKNNWKKGKTKIQFLFWNNICCSLENVLYLLFPSVFYRYFLKGILVMAAFAQLLQVLLDFTFSVLCCEILTLT